MVLPTVCAHAMSAEHELCTAATSSQGAPLAVFSIGYAIETSIGLQLACEGLETERASFRRASETDCNQRKRLLQQRPSATCGAAD